MTSTPAKLLPGTAAKEAKERLLSYLFGLGIDETGNLIVAVPRKSRPGVVGYYSFMSQFRGRARIVVDPNAIRTDLAKRGGDAPEWLVTEEVLKTLCHEYGHIMAEAMRVAPSRGKLFHIPDWNEEFQGDEEAFAEDFARTALNQPADHDDFWERFLPKYAAEFQRLFCGQEAPEPQAEGTPEHSRRATKCAL